MSHNQKSVLKQKCFLLNRLQERLSQQLDAVEVSITNQIAQKSHNFFQVREREPQCEIALYKLADGVYFFR